MEWDGYKGNKRKFEGEMSKDMPTIAKRQAQSKGLYIGI